MASIVDPDGLLEYSVVFTDRSLNHMSKKFQGVMNEVLSSLKRVYNAPTCVLIPGGGSFAMESGISTLNFFNVANIIS